MHTQTRTIGNQTQIHTNTWQVIYHWTKSSVGTFRQVLNEAWSYILFRIIKYNEVKRFFTLSIIYFNYECVHNSAHENETFMLKKVLIVFLPLADYSHILVQFYLLEVTIWSQKSWASQRCRYTQRPEEGVRPPGARVAGGCELPGRSAGVRTQVL